MSCLEGTRPVGISEVIRPSKPGHLWDEHAKRNIAGNSFHPAVIASMPGPPEALRAWLISDDIPAHHEKAVRRGMLSSIVCKTNLQFPKGLCFCGNNNYS